MKNFIAFLAALSVVGLVSVWADRPANTYAFQRDTLIASAAVLTLNTTPVELVPAPGSGFYLEFLRAEILLDYAGTAYATDANERLQIRYTNGVSESLVDGIHEDEFETTADQIWIVPSYGYYSGTVSNGRFKVPENAAIVAFTATGNWATGNSPLKIRVFYRVVSKAELEAIS